MTVPNQAQEMDPSVREAALAAMQTAGLSEENWPTDDEEVEADPEEDASSAATEEDESEESEDSVEEEEAEEDDSVPTEWFGVDLSGLPSSQRAEIIAHYKEQDRYAQSLAQKLAEKEEEPKPEETPAEEPEELDDDALMELLGVSKDDPMYDVKKEIQAPLARVIAQQQQALAAMQQRDEEAQFIQWWESGLDEMEQQFGPLSIDREDLAQIALKEGLRTPQEAYARVALSGRKTVEDLVAKAKEGVKEKAKKTKPSTQRPRSDNAQRKPERKLMSPTEAAIAAAKESGLDWGEALKNVI